MNTTSDLAALVSKKKVRIAGQGQDVSSFQGLIYARDSVEIRNTTVMGAIVSKDDAATTELENVTAVNVPELANWDIEQHLTLGEAKGTGFGGQSTTGQSFGIMESDGTFTPLSASNSILQALGAKLGTSSPSDWTWQFGSMGPNGFDSSTNGRPLDFLRAKEKWRDYVLENHENTVRVIEIFEINLNELTSLSQSLELIYHSELIN